MLVRPVTFKPSFEKHAGQRCSGVMLHVTNPALFRPVARSLADLSKVPPAWSSIADAVLSGISAHVGPEKEKWIDSLTFTGAGCPLDDGLVCLNL